MNSSPKADSHRYTLKIRPNNRGQFEVAVSSDMSVSDLKSIISAYSSIPSSQQRLITQGKLLKDDRLLSSYKLSEGHVIQVSLIPQEPPEANPSDVANRRERIRGLNQSDRFETVRQGLHTTSMMFEILNPRTEEEVIGFDNRQRHFLPGQWVDVLDTVEQWLEAQILEVASTTQGSIVYVHYNGWPAQWDEWIDSASPRIQPLHSFTNQSITAPVNCPYPNVPVDEAGLKIPGPEDLAGFLQQGAGVLSKMKHVIERYYALSTIYKHEKCGEKTAEMRNRIGISQVEDIKEWKSDCESPDEATVGCEDQESFDSAELPFQENVPSIETELGLLTVQTAPLLDRSGRLLSDLGSLMPSATPAVMPSPAELSLLTTSGRSDMGIHIYALLMPRRTN